MIAVIAALWLLLTPLVDSTRWAWTIVDVFETADDCEQRRVLRWDTHWLICAELPPRDN